MFAVVAVVVVGGSVVVVGGSVVDVGGSVVDGNTVEGSVGFFACLIHEINNFFLSTSFLRKEDVAKPNKIA